MNITHACSITALTAALVCGCGWLDRSEDGPYDDEGTSSADDGDGMDTDEPQPLPREGCRITPRFMLQEVPAFVTIEVGDGGGMPVACVVDSGSGTGYLCDAGDLVGPIATIRVDKDGFEPAVRNPAIVANSLMEIDVHLSVEGGPTGTWSPCLVPGEFETCDALCEAQTLSCAAASCATGQPEAPLATLELFADPECVDSLQAGASTCEEVLPMAQEVGSLRCCCTS